MTRPSTVLPTDEPRRRRQTILTLLLLAALLAGVAQSSSRAAGVASAAGRTDRAATGTGWDAIGRPSASDAGTTRGTSAGSTRPTVVLVHGAFADSSGWSQTVG